MIRKRPRDFPAQFLFKTQLLLAAMTVATVGVKITIIKL